MKKSTPMKSRKGITGRIGGWTERASVITLDHFRKDVVDVYRKINCEKAKALADKFQKGEFMAILSESMPDPLQYDDARAFAKDYLAYNVLRKAPGELLPTGLDLRQEALTKFHLVERRMQSLSSKLSEPCLDFPRDAIMSIAKRKIAKLLGRLDADEFLGNLHMSNGASTRLPRRRGNPAFKFCGVPQCTADIEELCRTLLYTDEVYMKGLNDLGPNSPECVKLDVVPGSRLDTVPKNAKTDRTIAIEPELNMWFQKSVGSMIRKRLRYQGIDLNDQSVNQRLALVGSRTGSLVTIDLESASDSISVDLCRELLPPHWFNFMDRIRSKCYTEEQSKWYTPFVKFSTMGNGFTFELESLLFWALVRATVEYYNCSDDRVSVYGDDIICHNSVAEEVIRMLDEVGFKTNNEKTFLRGPFRESCGKHYFYGVDVSPFNVTKLMGNFSDHLYLLNRYREWARKMGFSLPRSLSTDLSWCPRTPPSYGYRAGVILYDAPVLGYRENFYRFSFFTSEVYRMKVPHFGAYYHKITTGVAEVPTEVALPSEFMKLRKATTCSVWE